MTSPQRDVSDTSLPGSLVFASSQDFVLSASVSKPHFSAKYSAYLSIPQHASALSWSQTNG
ncbi:hypothetical protein [Escherichia coli]|uniref:hypothetical protein n=1 Tax=Escherichia coli TaxID=562 RepID=UPI00399F2E91